ncbi:serine hydrolase domain-containing protein [[Mycobacterium] wendilense]|uniref:Serine hydrolase domain-containing protein n=1 Tax=[Mycobacterium] wendilense TaxID=3064284 RepID=A0ABN9P5H1_9MYCO|nr:serine hydrolase domain-containing protein [Mycolicibacterium sp. MU0050]CAJ1587521.1 serine hydrolase domain-containing protein [Mycolicibacterium sp. MU0050]
MTAAGSRLTRLWAVGTIVCTLASCGQPPDPSPTGDPSPARVAAASAPRPAAARIVGPAEFAPVYHLVEAAVAAGRLPGAVVQVGHGGEVVLRRAFGSRKLTGEPGLDGSPSPAEPMTEDTIFDLASLTKPLTTATAILRLHEDGLVRLDEPVQTYLPDFNPDRDPRRARVTLRMLLTHTSGIAGDLSLDGPWGLDRPDKAEGIRRALAAQVVSEPGERFHYSDIGFILLGALLEKITGEPEDVHVEKAIFDPLGMSDSYYLPVAKACGPHRVRGTAVAFDPAAGDVDECPPGSWHTALLARVAPTALDEDTPGRNPDFGHPLRGTVHDPTARRMGGVAGSAGLFATAHDLGLYAQALLDRLAGRPSRFPLTRASALLMTTPQQPGDTGDLRGLGWDIDTAHSAPRGRIFPVGSFGHTGFTGTTLWLDPGSNTYVVVLANVIHVRGAPPIANLSGEVATASARALGLYGN